MKAGEVDLAVLPIENTAAGSVDDTYDLLRENEVSIVGEETSSVDFCLCGVSEIPLGAISRVLAAGDGLEQCSRFLQTLPNAEQILQSDTGGAMRLVHAAGDPTHVAIGAPEAAAAHGLVVLRRGIANHAENYTRFVVLARHPVPVELNAPCKTSLILITRHEHGALMRSLGVLAASGHSMTKLESRPRPGRPFEYMFFIDFEGNVAEPRTADALDDLRSTALHLKVLGSYPATTTRVTRNRETRRRSCPGARGERRARNACATAAGNEIVEELPSRRAWRAGRRYRDPGRQPAHRWRRIPRDGGSVLGRVGRADQCHRSRGSRGRRSDSAWWRLQASNVTVRIPGPRLGGPGTARGGRKGDGDADHQRGHGRRPGETHG